MLCRHRIPEFNLVISADYTRYKAKYNQTQAIDEHEHVPINEIYFSFYRIAGTDQLFESTLKTYFNPFSVYIWTLFGISWLVGLIFLIVDSASKLTTRPTKNREEKNCTICSESEHLSQHRILLDSWYYVIIHFQVQIEFPVINHFNKPFCVKD